MPIYLDYNASTPIDPAVAAEMRPLLERDFGNPSTSHWAGAPARVAVETARRRVADLLGSDPSEIVFTSGGSEANNQAIKGFFFAARRRGQSAPHFVTTSVEHPAVLEPLRFVQSLGASVTILPVDRDGRVSAKQVDAAITSETVLVSIMHANNETGTLMPMEEISAVTRARKVPLHTDAAQSVGKIPTRVGELGVDLLSVAGHKLYGPKGVGALYVRRGFALEPLIHGAGHENGRRAGTENVILIAGLGKACEVAGSDLGMHRVRELRDRFESTLLRAYPGRVTRNGHPTQRLPNTSNLNFVGKVGAEILAGLGDVAASTGSACHSGSVNLSPVLRAMSVPSEEGIGAVRFSLGRPTTGDEIEELLRRLTELLAARNRRE